MRGDTVEKTLARAFRAYSYQTRQLLFPEEEAARSVLFPRALAQRAAGLTGVTRVGAFGLQQALCRLRGLSLESATERVKSLQDDVVLRFPAGHLWITRWTDVETAVAFADVWRVPSAPADASILIWDHAVVVRKGTIPDPAVMTPVLAELLKPVR